MFLKLILMEPTDFLLTLPNQFSPIFEILIKSNRFLVVFKIFSEIYLLFFTVKRT